MAPVEDVVRGPVVVGALAGAGAVEVAEPEAGAPVVDAGVVDGAVVAAAFVLTAAALEAGRVELVDDCVELPHPATRVSRHMVPNGRSRRCITRG
jgi:hypothetical protein